MTDTFAAIVRVHVRADDSQEAAEIVRNLLDRLEGMGDLDGYHLLVRPFTPTEEAILD